MRTFARHARAPRFSKVANIRFPAVSRIKCMGHSLSHSSQGALESADKIGARSFRNKEKYSLYSEFRIPPLGTTNRRFMRLPEAHGAYLGQILDRSVSDPSCGHWCC